MTEQEKSKQTQELLLAISRRLAGRDDCKDVNYIIEIDHTGVKMSPTVYVYPNRYKKKESDKLDIVSYIHLSKLPNSNLSDFVFGKYIYESSFDSKKRRWTRIQ